MQQAPWAAIACQQTPLVVHNDKRSLSHFGTDFLELNDGDAEEAVACQAARGFGLISGGLQQAPKRQQSFYVA